MRRIIDLLINIYLSPLTLSSRLAMYIKGLILRYDEHYLCTIDVIKRRFKNSQGTIVDIGAFNGDSAIYMAKAFPAHEILAFEPNPISFKEAVRLCNPYSNIKVNNLGFSNISGSVDFYVTNDSVSSSLLQPELNTEIQFSKKIQVDVVTLDSYLHNVNEILLLKLDVQGAELSILQQGTQTLKRTRMVLTEMLNSNLYTNACQYYQVDEILRMNGFVLYSLFSSYNNEGTKYFDALYLNGQHL